MSVWAVVLAGGTGRRFGQVKQFLPVDGQRSVDRVTVTATKVAQGVVLVLPAGVAWTGPGADRVVAGGETRSDSVRAGLAAVPDDASVIVVHDAAHPLATETLFRTVVTAVLDGADGAVCTLPLTEVVQRVVDGVVEEVLPKQGLVLAQSPAAFRADVLRAAHATGATATEDVELVLRTGARVVTVPGDPCNIHVTVPAEWTIAGALAPLQEHEEVDERRHSDRPGGRPSTVRDV